MTDRKKTAKAIGAQVKALRAALGLTQRDVAIKCGMNYIAQYGAIEAGRSCPSTQVLMRVAAALGCTVNDLLPEQAVQP